MESGFSIFYSDTLVSLSPPFIDTRSQVLGVESSQERDRIISYKVEEGDTIEFLSDKFNISEETIRWANSLEGKSISPGDELLILPVTGVLYYVQRGDTLGHIAQRHKASESNIIAFNQIENEEGIRPGDQIIIPEGEKPPTPIYRPPTGTFSGRFVRATHGVVTQGSHARHQNAVDIANACGTPVYAISSGRVVRSGYDGRAGNYIWVDHGGMKTLYAHLQHIYVSSGRTVSAGEQIGTMGNTGYTIGHTGCHLHLETRGITNPFSHLRRGDSM